MGGGDYNVLLLRPQDIAHVIDIGKALHKVLALQNEREIETYKVFSRSAENRQQFCTRMAESRLTTERFGPQTHKRREPNNRLGPGRNRQHAHHR